MSVSFGGMGEVFATFKTYGTVEAGMPVQMHENGTVKACGADGRFMGIVAAAADDGYATVQVKGYAEAAYTGAEPAVGYCGLAGGDDGTVAVSENGGEYLVLCVDTAEQTVGFIM